MRTFSMIAVAIILLLALAPSANAQITVGGHVGFVVPWVTHDSTGSGTTTTQFDNYNIGFPIGVTFKGPGHVAVDLETIPFVSANEVNFVVDPGILYGLSHGVTIGGRVAFSVNSPTGQIGFIPLINKSWKFKNQNQFFKAYFVEADFPVQFTRPAGGPTNNQITFATHFGLGF